VKALIVDDSRPVRMLLGRMLRALGYTTTEACDGSEALAKLAQEGPFELALFDWNMPVMNGFDLLRAVRSQAALQAMRILMVTTETEVERVTTALEAGATEYLMKPFTQEVLAAKLEMMSAAG
jgi:two-component system chemotaxis response regulator CheY